MIRKHVQEDTLPALRELIAEQSKAEDFKEVFKDAPNGGGGNKSDGMVIAKD